MQPLETISRLTEFENRGGGTDSERRAARWLATQLAASGRKPRVEPFWCRANWALAHAWHVALAIAGSLLSVSSPRVGGVLVLVALLSIIADAMTGLSPGRRLTPERASQNVVAPERPGQQKRVRLIITANYDAPRIGLVYRDALRSITARARTALKAPGWLGWLAIALIWLIAIAILRLGGHRSTSIGVAQLIPTVGLVLGFAALIEIAIGGYSPGANDNASGVAVALAIASALDVAPPVNLATEVLLQGAGDHGLRAYLKTHRLDPAEVIVLGVAPSGAGMPRWWLSDGQLIPLRYTPRLREIAAGVAADARQSTRDGPAPTSGRGATPAWPARLRRLPAITIGCLDDRGLAPRSSQLNDISDAIEKPALDRTVQFGLVLIDAIDATVAKTRASQRDVTTTA